MTYYTKRNKEKFYITLKPLFDRVTGSCILLTVNYSNRKESILIDCGLFQGDEEAKNKTLPLSSDTIKNIKAVFLTHAHADHSGRLPLLVRKGYTGNIFTSQITKDLATPLLKDSCKILSERSRIYHQSRPPYTEKDATQTLEQMVSKPFNETFKVTDNIEVTLLPNSHILGSAMIYITALQGDERINLCLTGDFNDKNRLFIQEGTPERFFKDPVVVIQESLYGTTEDTEINNDFYETTILKCIGSGMSILALSFSLERFLVVLLPLLKLKKEGKIKVPIHADGPLAFTLLNIYKKHYKYLKVEVQELLRETINWVNSPIERESVLKKSDGQRILVATSGMGNFGPNQIYLPQFVTRKNFAIFLNGYAAENTAAGNIKNAKQGDKVLINGASYQLNATCIFNPAFSSHAKQGELLNFLKKFNKLQGVIPNHAEKHVKNEYIKSVMEEVKPKAAFSLNEGTLIRISPHGIDKVYPENI